MGFFVDCSTLYVAQAKLLHDMTFSQIKALILLGLVFETLVVPNVNLINRERSVAKNWSDYYCECVSSPYAAESSTFAIRKGMHWHDASIYWRHGRKIRTGKDRCKSSRRNSHRWHQWNFCNICFRCYCNEMAAGMRLLVCVMTAPFIGLIILLAKGCHYMMPTLTESLRCLSEVVLLCSMWQGFDTNIVAVLGWLAWTLNLHCSSALKCRVCSWLVVCLSQQEPQATKLAFLSFLIIYTPLFAKRKQPESWPLPKKKKQSTEVNQVSTYKDALVLALEVARSTLERTMPSTSYTHFESDLYEKFPYIPDLLLAVLLSHYGEKQLREVLQTDWSRSLKLWKEFDSRMIKSTQPMTNADEQSLCSEFLKRFCNIHAAQKLQEVTDEERKNQLESEQFSIGRVRGNGDCLIASLLEELVYEAGLLPEDAVTNIDVYDNLCSACRQALIALPAGDIRKPVKRDLTTNIVVGGCSDADNNYAYLQCDVHGAFILNFFLECYEIDLPEGGFNVVEYCRFDHVLGSPASQVMLAHPVVAGSGEAIEIGLYNSTGTGICGYHYEPVFRRRASFSDEYDVPPPPPPLTGQENERPKKRTKLLSNITTSPSSVPDKSEAEEMEPQSFYRIKALQNDDTSGDRRENLYNALCMVSAELRDDPTLPCDPEDESQPDPSALKEDVAVELPAKHCAFIGCAANFSSDAELMEHLQQNSSHKQLLSAVTRCMPPSNDSEAVRLFSAYCEALAEKVREGAPLDTYSIDRRAILNYNRATADDQIYSLICFSCARRFPYVASLGQKNEIHWRRPLVRDKTCTFFGMGPEQCTSIYGLDTYMKRYGHQPGFPDMRQHAAEFDDWQLKIPYHDQPLTILCCPEDRVCSGTNDFNCIGQKTLCQDCSIPICNECEGDLKKIPYPKMPQAALTNDLMIFYAPTILYEKKVTIMEQICASVCLTTMISFTLERKYRGKEQKLFDQSVHMQRHTTGTRGNATTFPMPWQEILKMLQEIEPEADNSETKILPNSGAELVRWVQVLLKTSGDDSISDMKGLVHQATVRADVVVDLILELKNRGHRAYKDMDMELVRKKADVT